MTFYRTLRLSFFAFVLIGIQAIAAPVSSAPGGDEFATGEDVAIAFFKAGHTNPNFDLWAKNTRNYKVAPPARASEILFEEKQRLIKKWQAYDLEENVLDIGGKVNVELQKVLTKEGIEEYWMHLTFEEGDVTYFPYKFQDYEFAVIPQQIETLLIQKLQKEQYDLINGSIKNGEGMAYISLQLKPVKAYMQQPYKIDNKEQWALLCDIATMSLISPNNKQTLWNYGANWYVSPVTQELRDLYREPAKNTEATPAAPNQ